MMTTFTRGRRAAAAFGLAAVLVPALMATGPGLAAVDALLDAAYQVVLADDGESLQWVTREGGVLRTYDREPDMNAWDKLKQGVLRILPVEEEL